MEAVAYACPDALVRHLGYEESEALASALPVFGAAVAAHRRRFRVDDAADDAEVMPPPRFWREVATVDELTDALALCPAGCAILARAGVYVHSSYACLCVKDVHVFGSGMDSCRWVCESVDVRGVGSLSCVAIEFQFCEGVYLNHQARLQRCSLRSGPQVRFPHSAIVVLANGRPAIVGTDIVGDGRVQCGITIHRGIDGGVVVRGNRMSGVHTGVHVLSKRKMDASAWDGNVFHHDVRVDILYTHIHLKTGQ